MDHDHKELGCCGYDELVEKPPTTEPFRIGKMQATNVWKNNEAGITRRINTAMGSGRIPTIHLNLNRLPGAPAIAFRPPSWRPARMLASTAPRPEMGQAAGIAAFGMFTALVFAALGAGTAWVGYSTGQREKGFLSYLGYGIGTLGGLAALVSVGTGLLWIAGVSSVSQKLEEIVAQPRQPMVQGGPEAAPPPAPGLLERPMTMAA